MKLLAILCAVLLAILILKKKPEPKMLPNVDWPGW